MLLPFLLWGGSLVLLGSCSWAEEFLERYRGRGAALLGVDDDWARRTAEYGVNRPTRAGRVFLYRAFDLWSNVGPFYRAATEVYPTMHPDELLTRVALHWPDGLPSMLLFLPLITLWTFFIPIFCEDGRLAMSVRLPSCLFLL